MKKIICISFLVIIIFTFSGYTFGQIATDLGGFNKIKVFGKINVRLEKSTNDSLFVQSGSFDISQVKFSVEDSVLNIKLLTEFPPEIKVDVTVNFQHINAVKVGGGAKIYNKGTIESKFLKLSGNSGCEIDLLVNIDSLSVSVTKGAFVRLTGQNRYLNLKTCTGGDFRSTKMTNKVLDAKMRGGSAEVLCSDLLTSKVSFGATLKYVELPKKINKKEKTGGSVGKLQDF